MFPASHTIPYHLDRASLVDPGVQRVLFLPVHQERLSRPANLCHPQVQSVHSVQLVPPDLARRVIRSVLFHPVALASPDYQAGLQ